MAQIDPHGIRHTTECFAVIKEEGFGFLAGRLLNWILHDLRYPLVQRQVKEDPRAVEAAFDTREELEAYLEKAEPYRLSGKPRPH